MILRFLLSALCGIALTLGIAYYAAVRPPAGEFLCDAAAPAELPQRIQRVVNSNQRAFTVGSNESFGRKYCEYYARYGSYTDSFGVHFEQDAMTYAIEPAASLETTAHSLLNDYPAPPGTTRGDIAIELFALIGPGDYAHLTVGWPMPAFEGYIERDVGGGGCSGPYIKSERRHNLRTTAHSRGPWNIVGSIPYGPMPAGIAVNVIFFGACTWLLLFAVNRGRSFWRSNHRLCPHCKYPIGVSPVCTECGRDLPERIIQRITAQISANPDPS